MFSKNCECQDFVLQTLHDALLVTAEVSFMSLFKVKAIHHFSFETQLI